MLPQQPSSHASTKSRGFTLMIMGGPGREPRRLYVPHWLCALLLAGWLAVMLVAAWFGFQSAADTEGESAATVSSRASTAAVAPGKSSAWSTSSPRSRQE